MEQRNLQTKPSIPTANSRKKRFITGAGVVFIGLAAGFTGSWIEGLWTGENSINESTYTTAITNNAKGDGNAIITNNEESIAGVARSVAPSVVSILTSKDGRYADQQGAGTGMIVSSNGYILTNKHVVSGADNVTVVLQNGKEYADVKVVGADPLNDIAFLKIKDASDLPAITLGDSKTIRIGQSVVAIGNALGQYQNTVTSGIVSGTGRPIIASSDGTSGGQQESLSDLLQTDAAINSGNSGGPLLNLKGQVIGINTAIAQDAQGIGFAIPIGAAKGLLAHVVKTGKVERAYLGVRYVSITPAVKAEYGLPVDKGDYVIAERGESVGQGTPADKAGIQNKDIILEINGVKAGETASVASLIGEYQPGDKVKIVVLRKGKAITLDATLGVYRP